MNRYVIIIAVVFIFALVGMVWFFSTTLGPQDESARDDSGFFNAFFPFGRGPVDGGGGGPSPDTDIIDTTNTGPVPVLRQVSTIPIAGATVFADDNGEEVIRYVERGTGHVFETLTSVLVQSRASNTTIPRIQDAVWFNSGQSVVLRYIDEDDNSVESFVADVNPDGTLTGSFLERGIHSIESIGNTLRYHVDQGPGSSLVQTDLDGGSLTELYTSPFAGWHADWIDSNTAVLTEKPSFGIPGSAFIVNTATDSINPFITAQNALTVNAEPGNSKIMFSSINNNIPILGIYDVDDESAIQLPLATFSEKCAWSSETYIYCAAPRAYPDGALPDDWYKGVVSLSDDLWRINIDSLVAERLIALPENAGMDIDAINVFVAPSGEHLLFMNKNDSTLWSLRLPEPPAPSEEESEESTN